MLYLDNLEIQNASLDLIVKKEDKLVYSKKHKILMKFNSSNIQLIFLLRNMKVPSQIDIDINFLLNPDDEFLVDMSYDLSQIVILKKNNLFIIETIWDFFDQEKNSHKIMEFKNNEKIFSLEFLRFNQKYNLLVVLENKLKFCKISKKNKKVILEYYKDIYLGEINTFDYDYKKEIICLNFLKKPSEIFFYKLNDIFLKSHYHFKSITLNLTNLDDSRNYVKLQHPVSQIKNTLKKNYELENIPKIQKIGLIWMYQKLFLLHFNLSLGKLFIYNIEEENEILIYKIIPDYRLFFNIVDDLLIFHYREENISIIIDYKNSVKEQFFGPPFSITNFNKNKNLFQNNNENLKKNNNFDDNNNNKDFLDLDIDFLVDGKLKESKKEENYDGICFLKR